MASESDSNAIDSLIADSPLTPDGVGSPLPPVPVSSAPIQPATTSGVATADRTSSGLLKSSTVYTAVSTYRATFRTKIPAHYSVWQHIGAITVCAAVCFCAAIWLGGGFRSIYSHAASWVAAVIAFGLCNWIEYNAHRFKLHNPLVHTRHSHTHHRFFTDRSDRTRTTAAHCMEFDEFRDAHAIFFPPGASYILCFAVIPLFSAPVWIVLGGPAAASFAATLAAYYGSYEWMHLSYHAPPDSWLGRLPGVSYLRRHHQIHHNQGLMGKYNFNITWPILDFWYGTTWTPDATATPQTNATATPQTNEAQATKQQKAS